MYGRINRDNIHPRVDAAKLERDARYYRVNRKLFSDIHSAMTSCAITRQQHDTLCGQVRAGDAEGAEKGFMRLMGARV